jgi:hypothetical protein
LADSSELSLVSGLRFNPSSPSIFRRKENRKQKQTSVCHGSRVGWQACSVHRMHSRTLTAAVATTTTNNNNNAAAAVELRAALTANAAA